MQSERQNQFVGCVKIPSIEGIAQWVILYTKVLKLDTENISQDFSNG